MISYSFQAVEQEKAEVAVEARVAIKQSPNRGGGQPANCRLVSVFTIRKTIS